MLSKLEALAYKIKIKIRYEPLGTDNDTAQIHSGMVTLQGKSILIVDSRIDIAQRCAVICLELSRLDLSKVYIPPAVRMLIEDSKQVG